MPGEACQCAGERWSVLNRADTSMVEARMASAAPTGMENPVPLPPIDPQRADDAGFLLTRRVLPLPLRSYLERIARRPTVSCGRSPDRRLLMRRATHRHSRPRLPRRRRHLVVALIGV